MRAILLLVVFLCGCVTKLVDIDYNIRPPEDWPYLQERITYGSIEEVHRWCNMPEAMRDRAFNCATVNFDRRTCSIYLSHQHIPGALEHERAHCRGYDHVGDTNRSRNAWEQWKNLNPR